MQDYITCINTLQSVWKLKILEVNQWMYAFCETILYRLLAGADSGFRSEGDKNIIEI